MNTQQNSNEFVINQALEAGSYVVKATATVHGQDYVGTAIFSVVQVEISGHDEPMPRVIFLRDHGDGRYAEAVLFADVYPETETGKYSWTADDSSAEIESPTGPATRIKFYEPSNGKITVDLSYSTDAGQCQAKRMNADGLISDACAFAPALVAEVGPITKRLGAPDTLPPSIPLNKTTEVKVTFKGGGPNGVQQGDVDYEISPAGAGNEKSGSAKIARGTLQNGEETVIITGLTQTSPGAPRLKIEVKDKTPGANNATIGTSSGFSVCAHPRTTFEFTKIALGSFRVPVDLGAGPPVPVNFVGLDQEAVTFSDSGDKKDLDKCLIIERIGSATKEGEIEATGSFVEANEELVRLNNPRFPPFLEGTAAPQFYGDKDTVDINGMPAYVYVFVARAKSDTGTATIQQLVQYRCERCGMTENATIHFSGAKMTFATKRTGQLEPRKAPPLDLTATKEFVPVEVAKIQAKEALGRNFNKTLAIGSLPPKDYMPKKK